MIAIFNCKKRATI